MKLLLLATAIALLPLPALAENWMFATTLSDGSTVAIDLDTIKRSYRDTEWTTFKVQVQGIAGTSQGSINGNCRTGYWRLSSRRSRGNVAFTLADVTGDQLLRQACGLPYTLTTPKSR